MSTYNSNTHVAVRRDTLEVVLDVATRRLAAANDDAAGEQRYELRAALDAPPTTGEEERLADELRQANQRATANAEALGTARGNLVHFQQQVTDAIVELADNDQLDRDQAIELLDSLGLDAPEKDVEIELAITAQFTNSVTVTVNATVPWTVDPETDDVGDYIDDDEVESLVRDEFDLTYADFDEYDRRVADVTER